MNTIGGAALGTTAIAGSHEWAVITVAITSPGASTDDTFPTVTWTYSNSLGYAQAGWRVRLTTQLGTVLDDSAWMTGTDTSHTIGFALAGNSTYVLDVMVRDSDGQVAVATQTFTAEAQPPVVTTINPEVGRRWDVAINGIGYMLATGVDQKWQRQVAGLDAPRFATSDTPLAGAVDRYAFMVDADLSGGAGQIEGDRASSSPTRYRESHGIDPFSTPGVVELLPSVASSIASNYGSLRGIVVGGSLYVLTGANELTYQTTPGGAATAFSVASAGTVVDLTTDGAKWYACDGTGIWRGTTSDPGGAWCSENATHIAWAGSRICAAVDGNVLKTITDAGAVEDTLLTLPAGQTIVAMAPGGSQLYFGVVAGNVGSIYAWQIGSTDAPRVVWQLPTGETPIAMMWYQGQLVVRVERNGLGAIYRCPTSTDGSITPFLLAEPLDDVGDVASSFASRGRFVYFPLCSDTYGHGCGIIDLSTGGWCAGLEATPGAGLQTSDVLVWQGRIVLVLPGSGVWVEEDTKVASGWYTTSVRDGATALDKVFDEVTVQAQPLTGGATVELSYSFDRGQSYVPFTNGTLTGNGTARKTTPINLTSQSIAWLVTLNGDAHVTMVQSKAHVLGLADQLLQLPIDCRDEVRTRTGAPTGRVRGDGVRLVRQLEALAQTQVVVQDIDWSVTQLAESYELLRVESVSSSPVRDRHLGMIDPGIIAVVTLRKTMR